MIMVRCNILYDVRQVMFVVATTVAIVATALFVGAHQARGNPDPAPSSDPIWSSKFKDLSGTEQSLGQWKGKTVLIYFWATWCAPCHKEAPRLSNLYDKYKDKGFVVIGLAVDNADKVRKFVEDKDLKNPTVYGGSEAIQLGRDLGNDLGAIPYTVIVDQKGNVVETLRGDTPDGKVEGLISNLLG